MRKIIAKYQAGFSLLELLIVIAIIGILASIYVSEIHTSDFQKMKMASEQLSSDINYIRSLATSRATYNGSYPGSYGITFYNGDGSGIASYYVLYAGNTTNELKRVTFSNKSFRIVDPNLEPFNINYRGNLFFSFSDENKISSSFQISPSGAYEVAIMQTVAVSQGGHSYNTYNKFVLSFGRVSGDNYTWSGVSMTYDYISPECGNGKLETESGESCDLGNQPDPAHPSPQYNWNHGPCKENCQFNLCGDGYLNIGVEQCDTSGVRTCQPPSPLIWCYDCGRGADCGSNGGNGSCVSDQNGECQWSSERCGIICPISTS